MGDWSDLSTYQAQAAHKSCIPNEETGEFILSFSNIVALSRFPRPDPLHSPARPDMMVQFTDVTKKEGVAIPFSDNFLVSHMAQLPQGLALSRQQLQCIIDETGCPGDPYTLSSMPPSMFLHIQAREGGSCKCCTRPVLQGEQVCVVVHAWNTIPTDSGECAHTERIPWGVDSHYFGVAHFDCRKNIEEHLNMQVLTDSNLVELSERPIVRDTPLGVDIELKLHPNATALPEISTPDLTMHVRADCTHVMQGPGLPPAPT